MYDEADDLYGKIHFTAPVSGRAFSSNNVHEVTVGPVVIGGVTYGATFAYTYDANGNRTVDETRAYTWDAENRLVRINYTGSPSKNTVFRYDGLGRRIAQIETNGSTVTETRYLWCGEEICQMRDSTDTVITRYTSEGAVLPTHPTPSLRSRYYARDHLGSVRNILAVSTGATLGTFSYDPYGQTKTSSIAPANDFRFAGMFLHPESGLYLTHYRVYDPKDARWLSRDPIGEAMGVNLYTYGNNDPLRYADPDGLAGYDPRKEIAKWVLKRVWNGCTWTWKLIRNYGKPNPEDFEDPANLPKDWEWRTNPKKPGEPGSRDGAYYNPKTKESMHNDTSHPQGKDPHWTYTDKNGVRWDNFGNGWNKQ